jgi:hypothetical protein
MHHFQYTLCGENKSNSAKKIFLSGAIKGTFKCTVSIIFQKIMRVFIPDCPLGGIGQKLQGHGAPRPRLGPENKLQIRLTDNPNLG